jgi:hypothetical protein
LSAMRAPKPTSLPKLSHERGFSFPTLLPILCPLLWQFRLPCVVALYGCVIFSGLTS